MGEENNMVTENTETVADIVKEETQIVETEESENQSSTGRAIAIGVAAAGVAAGAGYGLYRLGKFVVGKVMDKLKKEEDEFEDFDDDDGDEPIPELVDEAPGTEVAEAKPEFPDHKKKKH